MKKTVKPFKFSVPEIEKISESLWHEKRVDIGMEETLRFFSKFLPMERHDEFCIQGLMPMPRIFEAKKLLVKILPRMPHFIIREFADNAVISYHIGIKDYISPGPLSRFQYDAENRSWAFTFEQSLYMPPQQSFYVEMKHPVIRYDVESFCVRVELEGFLGREVM